MATKTNFIYFFLILLTWNVHAQDDEKQLKAWTKTHEAKLTNKYKLIPSTWFQNECLKLAASLKLNKINQCHLFQSQHINAYVFNNGHVYFSTTMMQLINNKHQWASILAHEYAHIKLNHYSKQLKKLQNPPLFFPKSKIKNQKKLHEQQADEWSKKTLTKYEMDSSQINYFLQRVSKTKKQNKHNSHIKISKRIKKPNDIEIIDKAFLSNLIISLKN